jgi:hypothetical protein
MGQEGAVGLMKVTPPPLPLTVYKEVLNQQTIPPGMTFTIKAPTFYKYAIVVCYGDGSPLIIIRVFIGARQLDVGGSEYKVLAVGNDTLEIRAENTDTSTSRITPRIEIIYLSWS